MPTAPWVASGEVDSINSLGYEVIGLAMGGYVRINDFRGFGTKFFQSGRISNLRCKMFSNTITQVAKFQLQIIDESSWPVVETNLNSIVTWNPGVTGWSVVCPLIDNIPSGTTIRGNFFVDVDGPGACLMSAVVYEWTPDDTGVTETRLFATGTTGSTVFDGTNDFFGFGGQIVGRNEPRETEWYLGINCQIKWFQLGIANNTRSTTTTCAIHMDGIDTPVVVTIPPSTPSINDGFNGYYDSGVLEVTGVDGDKIGGHFTFGGGTGTLAVRSVSVSLITTDGTFTGGLGQRTRSTNNFFPMAGLNTDNSGLYASDTKFGFAWLFTKLTIHTFASDGGTLEVIQNEVPSGFIVTIPSGSPPVAGIWYVQTGELPIAIEDLLRLVLTRLGPGLEFSVITWVGKQAGPPPCPGEVTDPRIDGLPYTPPVIPPCEGAGLISSPRIGARRAA